MAAPMNHSQAPQMSAGPNLQALGPGAGGGGLNQGLPQQQQDFDPVQRYKMLIPQLKESLQNLMKIAAQNLVQNTNIDNGQKSADGPVQRFDKSLEEFYALCDQLELCLRLAYECLSQSYDSAKHSPTLVPTATKPDAVQTESLPYTQYLSMIKSQISCAKDIHNALLECSKKNYEQNTPQPGTSLITTVREWWIMKIMDCALRKMPSVQDGTCPLLVDLVKVLGTCPLQNTQEY